VLSGGEEYKVKGKVNILLQVGSEKTLIKNVYYVPCLEKNILLIGSIMKPIHT
jgi:hypothetical protein